MSVTQDYKILTLTHGEFAVVEHALTERARVLTERIAFFEPMGTHTGLVREMKGRLADVQSALAKVRA